MGTDRRLLRILDLGQSLLDTTRGISLDQYAKKHGHSRSAIYRDIEVLRDHGFPIKSEGGRYRLAADVQLFGRRGLEADELLALFVARQVAARIPGSRFDRALASVWAKVTGDGGQPALIPTGDGALSVAAFRTIDYGPYRTVIDHLEDAIDQRVAVRLRYRKASTGEVSDRVVEPGQLHADAAVEGLFLIAFCRLRRAVRVFAIQRVLEASQTGERFTLRPETRSRVALRDAFRVWIGKQEAPVLVRIRFKKDLAGEVGERRWHPSQVTIPSENGDLRLELRMADPAELVRWLMAYGADAVVEEPAWLADDLRMRHRRASELVEPAVGLRSRRAPTPHRAKASESTR